MFHNSPEYITLEALNMERLLRASKTRNNEMKKNENNNSNNKTTTIRQRKARAWRELKEIYSISSTRGLVLHHIDPTLKARDPDRYN